MKRKIGVFDSGFGGISVLAQMMKEMPNESFYFYGDSKYAPYGEKSKEEIKARCFHICEELVKQDVKAIVIACNTATSACIQDLRKMYDIPIIGMEPALKPAVHEKSKQSVIVMATPFTLKEEKFANLMRRYENNHTIIKLPTPKLVRLVEQDQLENKALCMQVLNDYFKDIDLNQVNAIVLGCTHFVFYKDYIQELVGNHITIYDGNRGTSKHLKQILETRQILNQQDQGQYIIYNSTEDEKLLKLSEKLLFKQLK